jgi:RNA polymerase sigma-70 factor (ECF subfamily)
MSRLRNPDSAEEVVQETFVSALQALDQYSGKGSEGAWLLGILKRKVIDCVRRRNRPDSASGGDMADDPAQVFFDAKGNWRTDPRVMKECPTARLEREEFWEAFRRCLERLSQRQADVFTLREIEELTAEEICKNLQISASNLWVLLHRARLQLSVCMKSQLEDLGSH